MDEKLIGRLPRRPVHRAAAEEMEMEYGLPRPGVRVRDETIPLRDDALLARDLRREEREAADHRRILRRIERRDVLARDHEDMRRRLRRDIAERDEPCVLGDDRGGDLLARDAAEEAVVRHGRAPSKP